MNSSGSVQSSAQGAISEADRRFLHRCVALAEEALEAGDEPFGSVLVDADGQELYADRNRVAAGDRTQHPEFAIARWAAAHLTPAERERATVYTSGEHCPMCSAAHAWVGLGRIVYAASAEQLMQWYAEWGVTPGPVTALPITTIAPETVVTGPDPETSELVRRLQARRHGQDG